jgi:surface protein
VNNGILGTPNFSVATDLVGIKPLLGIPQTVPTPYHYPKIDDFRIGNNDGFSSKDFVMVIDTTKGGSTTIVLSMGISLQGSVIEIFWGDGTSGGLIPAGTTQIRRPGSYETRFEPTALSISLFTVSHTYPKHGIYTVVIKGIMGYTITNVPHAGLATVAILSYGDLVTITTVVNHSACGASLLSVPPYIKPTDPAAGAPFRRNLADCFNGCSNLNTSNFTQWDTSNVIDMRRSFQNCNITVNGDWNWNTNLVVNFGNAFTNTRLSNITFSGWACNGAPSMFSFSNINDCSFINWSGNNTINMFLGATLNNCTLSGWRLTSLANGMFNAGTSAPASVTNLYMPSWDLRGVTNLNNMFYGVNGTKSGLNDWNVSGVTNMSSMFQFGSDFMVADLSNWNVSKVTNFQYFMLRSVGLNAGGNASIRIDNWNIASGANCLGMFGDTYASKFISLSGWTFGSNSSTARMFAGFNYPAAFNSLNVDLSSWNTSGIVDMNRMFENINSTMIVGNLSNWNTSNVTNMSGMFLLCGNFNTNVSGWDTSNVTNMANMFRGANSFAGSGLSNWRPNKCINFSSMFMNQVNPLAVGISGWTIASDANLSSMFQSSTAINSANFQNWTFNGSGINCTSMFNGCTNFRGIGLDYWNTSGISNMTNMFLGNTNFNNNLSGWNVANVTTMANAFQTANNFAKSGLSNWNVSKCTNFSNMFLNNTNSSTVGISGWTIASGANLTSMFQGASNINSGNFSNWIFNGNNINCTNMFNGCTNFRGVGLESWNTSGISNMNSIFTNNANLNFDASNWNTTKNTLFNMFGGCTSFAGSGLSNWNISKSVTFASMFTNGSLKVGITGWTIPNGADCINMFGGNLMTSGDFSNWTFQGNNVCSNMFFGAASFIGNGLNNWNVTGITTVSNMFTNCSSLQVSLTGWNLCNCTNFNNFMINTNIGSGNYDLLLNSWATTSTGNPIKPWATGINVNFGTAKYTAASSGARQRLVNYGWTITDGGFQA